MKFIPLLALWVFFIPLHVVAQDQLKKEDKKEDESPLKSSISLARQTIRENDSVQVQIWLSNAWDQNLTEVKLHVVTPSFLKWYVGTCKEWQEKKFQEEHKQFLSFGPVSARTVHAKTLCIKSDPDIVVGDFNLLFAFEYEWLKQNNPQYSSVVVEKTLKATLLGSDNVAGIPVGLAGFIVPGFFFWMVLTLFKVPWLPWSSEQLALGDRMIYSVLISMGIVVLGGQFKDTDISTGLGLTKLGYLAFMGLVLGIVVSIIDRLVRYLIQQQRQRQQKKAEEKLIKIGDGLEVLLEKLVERFPNIQQPRAIVLLKNGQRFKGSLAQQDAEGTALIGWFQIQINQQTKAITDRLKEFEKTRQWREILTLARSQELEIKIRDPIFNITAGGDEPQPDAYKTWASAEVETVNVEADKGDFELILLQ
jgi:hypothetical protein